MVFPFWIKVVLSAIVTRTDLVQILMRCWYWWKKYACQVSIFSKKAFWRYWTFCGYKLPLTLYRDWFWHHRKGAKIWAFWEIYMFHFYFFSQVIHEIWHWFLLFMAPKISHIHMIFKFWLVSPNEKNGGRVMAVFSNFGLNISRNKQMPNFHNFSLKELHLLC